LAWCSSDSPTEFARYPSWPAIIPGAMGTVELERPPKSMERVVETLTVALADLVLSAWLVAVTVCVPGVAGAVYRPLLEIVPVEELPPLRPSTDQVTPLLLLLVTVAVNCCVPPIARLADVGLMPTDTGPATVTLALAVLVVLALLTAFTVWLPVTAGAV